MRRLMKGEDIQKCRALLFIFLLVSGLFIAFKLYNPVIPDTVSIYENFIIPTLFNHTRFMAEAHRGDNEILQLLCEILTIDQEIALYYLNKTKWDVETAVDEYYKDTKPQDISLSNIMSAPNKAEHRTEDSGEARLKLLSWNLDGLDVENLEERTESVVSTILSKKPDIVILQEVVPYSLKVFKNACKGYLVLVGDYSVPYFNAILLRQDTVRTNKDKLQFVEFPTSHMGRHYLIQPIKFAEAKIIVMTSHLESLSRSSAERKKQFKDVLDYMSRQMTSFNIIFGGDTNLRDKEVTAIGGVPGDIQDLWVQSGSPASEEMTWDGKTNDNIKIGNEEKPSFRFDRFFLRPATNGRHLAVKMFKLAGKQRLPCGKFPSDHWAVWLEFEIQE